MDSDQQRRSRKKRSDRHRKSTIENKEEKQTPGSRSARRKNKKIIDKEVQPATRRARHQKQKTDTAEQEQPAARARKRTKEKVFPLTLKHYLIAVLAVFVLALIAYTTILYGGKVFVDQNKLPVSSPTTIETADGEPIWYIYDQYRKPIQLDDLPNYIPGAFVATEDKRFYTHSGVDFRSIMRAIYKDIISRSKAEGASTITQQLAKNLFLTNDKSWMRKTKEVMIALYLEREFTKDEILEMYMNVIYFGKGQYGIEAASNTFFDKSAKELTVEEAALLAGIVNAPNGYSPVDHPDKALQRRNLVLDRMNEAGIITEDEKNIAENKEIALHLTQRKTNNDAYQSFADLVIKEISNQYGISLEELKTRQYRIKTGFDKTAQTKAYQEFQEASNFPGGDNMEGAFVMMDQKKGQIVAAIGGRDFQIFNLNRATQMKRQPGSVMKPLAVYAPALETGDYSPYVMLPDKKQEWDGKEVRNANDQYAGEVNLYDALIYSKNTSAVWLLNELGLDYSKSYLNKMDMHMDEKKDGLNIALGGLTNGLSPVQLVEAYRAFAHNGETINAHAVNEIIDHQGKTVAKAEIETKDVFSTQTAWTMTEMMMGVVTKGTGSAGSYPGQLAGKTGTTQENHDFWFVGYTPEYVTALWMGANEAKKDQKINGSSSYPTKLTKKILTDINQEKKLAASFTKPKDVQSMEEPIKLPNITDLDSTFVFGGFKILKAKLTWSGTGDDRVIYRVYEANEEGEDKLVGEVTGGNEYVIDEFLLLQKKSYYVVPYDPLGDRNGEQSNTVTVSF